MMRGNMYLDAAVPRPSVVSRDLIADYFQSVTAVIPAIYQMMAGHQSFACE